MQLLRQSTVRTSAIFVVAICAAVGLSLQPTQAGAASSYVAGSYQAAMTFADQFCSDTSSAGVGPTYNGIGDLVWITAPDGSANITANQGDLYADVTVHIAGKFCGGYSGHSSGSNYVSDQGNVSGTMLYGTNTAGAAFHVSEGASLYIGNFGAGTHRINMSLASFFTLSNGAAGNPKVSPNAYTDLTITYIQKWTINGQSYVDNINDSIGRRQGNPALSAAPGDMLYWTHDMRNNGPNDMDRTVYYNVDRTGFGNGWDAIHEPTGRDSGAVNQLFVQFGGASGAAYTRYRVDASDGGRTLCARISWNDNAWNDTGWGSSGFACAFVPFNYNLKPSVDGLNNGTATVGGPIPTVSPQIDNSLNSSPGKTTDAPNAEWQLLRVEVPPNSSIPTAQLEDNKGPCAHYNNGGANPCTDKGTGTQAFPAGMTTLAQLTNELVGANTAVGTQICYTLSVKPYATGGVAGYWRHSAPECLTVNKAPKVQTWGGDLHTRGKILTQTSVASVGGTNKKFGSWVEYGGFSVGTNTNFATGSGPNNGNTNTTTADVWNKLTFANVNLSGSNSYGMFTLPSSLPTVASQFVGASTGGTAQSNLGLLSSGTYNVGDFTIDTSDIGSGKSIIIVSSGRVTITGNITYRGTGGGDSFTKASELPQVVIIADDIDIKNDATQVDAWLLTKNDGAINTCSDVRLSDPLNAKICEKPLMVNGPVMTSHLYLRRTGGADTVATAGAPAEVFNLRPDTFMWAYGRASQAGKAQTVYSVELPPRF
jgi:hypothetical protein